MISTISKVIEKERMMKKMRKKSNQGILYRPNNRKYLICLLATLTSLRRSNSWINNCLLYHQIRKSRDKIHLPTRTRRSSLANNRLPLQLTRTQRLHQNPLESNLKRRDNLNQEYSCGSLNSLPLSSLKITFRN